MTAKRLSLAAAAALALTTAAAPAAAQMRAILPTIDQVQPIEPLPIDGVWQIRELGKRVMIERGHAYAMDSWVHLMLFRIEPDQVVIKNIRELADGEFIAEDLPLMANVKLEWVGEDTLRGRTQGLIPVTYHLERLSDGDDFDRSPPRDEPEFDDEDLGPPPSDDDETPISPW